MFSPTKSALLPAVKKGHLTTFPGLTEEAINNHLTLQQKWEKCTKHLKSFAPLPYTKSCLVWKMKQFQLLAWEQKLTLFPP
jgi:hypothetical protein